MKQVTLSKRGLIEAKKVIVKRAKYGHVSRAVIAFKKNFLSKYGLLDSPDSKGDPLVIFGLYYPKDYSLYKNYKGKVIVVWCGGDSRGLNSVRAEIIKSRPAKHIAMGRFVSDSLKKHNIAHEITPICPALMKKCPVPRGDKLYFYGKPGVTFYGDNYLPKIKRMTGIEIVKAHSYMYTFDELKKIYTQCFLGLRLTPHDGLPNTVIEMGLMGRRSIYNGGTPHSIPWTGIDDICESITKEYKSRKQDNTNIAKDWEDYLNINDKWMYV